MSKLWKASGVAERALRKIGAFSINHTAADPEEMSETLYWMDLAVAELTGVEECLWLVPETLSISLDAGTVSYDLSNETIGTTVLYPVWVTLRDSSGTDRPVEIISRRQYEGIADKDASGPPEVAYIDRTSDAQLKVWPVPADATYSLQLVVQTEAADILGGTANGGGGNLRHGLPAAWQRWLILQTAGDIASGPVRRLPPGEVNEIRKEASEARMRLLATANREKTSNPRRTRAHGA